MPEEKKKYSTHRVHWYLVALEVHHLVPRHDTNGDLLDPGKGIQRMNVIVQSPERQITAKFLEDTRTMAFMRAEQQYNISPALLADYVILNINYMGHMSEREHFTKHQPKPESLPENLKAPEDQEPLKPVGT